MSAPTLRGTPNCLKRSNESVPLACSRCAEKRGTIAIPKPSSASRFKTSTLLISMATFMLACSAAKARSTSARELVVRSKSKSGYGLVQTDTVERYWYCIQYT